MQQAQLQSTKYLQNANGEIEFNEYKQKAKGRFKATCGFVFRSVLIFGIAASVYWFYLNQEPILANLRNNSGNYEVLIENIKTHFISKPA